MIDYNEVIEKATEHVNAGTRDSYTDNFLKMINSAILHADASSEQLVHLKELSAKLECLSKSPGEISFLGSSTI